MLSHSHYNSTPPPPSSPPSPSPPSPPPSPTPPVCHDLLLLILVENLTNNIQITVLLHNATVTFLNSALANLSVSSLVSSPDASSVMS